MTTVGTQITKTTTNGDGEPIVQTLEVVAEEAITNYTQVKNIIRSVVDSRLELPENTIEDVATLVVGALNDANLIA